MDGSKSKIISMNYWYNISEVGEIKHEDYSEYITFIVGMDRNDYLLVDNPFIQVRAFNQD